MKATLSQNQYTKCLECGSIYPSVLERGWGGTRVCLMCDSPGVCSIDEIDIERVIAAEELLYHVERGRQE